MDKYHQSTMIYIKITLDAIKERQYYMIKIKGDELVCGSSNDSVNYRGKSFNNEDEVIKDVQDWYKGHEQTLKEFAKFEKLYGKLGKNLFIGEEYGTTQILPFHAQMKIDDKIIEKIAKKFKMDVRFDDNYRAYFFGDKSKLEKDWMELDDYHNEFELRLWNNGTLRSISSAETDSWDKPTKTFVTFVQFLDKL